MTHSHAYGFALGGYYGVAGFEGSNTTGALKDGIYNPVGWTEVAPQFLTINSGAVRGTQEVEMKVYTTITQTSLVPNLSPYITVYFWKRVA